MIQSTQSFDARSGPPEVHSVDQLLRDTFEKLKSLAPKRNKDLRDECTAGLERLDAAVTGAHAHGCVSADDYFKALKLGCACQGAPKVVAMALDGIQKLLACGFLTGKGADPFKEAEQGAPPRMLMDSVIETVCECEEQSDDTVQLQMVRVLLTGVTSQTCEIHCNSLMTAVKTCFQIHRDSKNAMNQRTASAYLTQMLGVVAQRMELSSADMSRRTLSIDDGGAGDTSRTKQARAQTAKDLAAMAPSKLLEDWMSSYVTRVVDKIVLEERTETGADRCSGGGSQPGKFGWCVVCRNPAPHYCVHTQDPVCGHACKFRNLERIELVETHYGARRGEEEGKAEVIASIEVAAEGHHVEVGAVSTNNVPRKVVEANPQEQGPAQQLAVLDDNVDGCFKGLNPYHQDALLVFSSLCKLSMKDLPAGPTDSKLVRSKRLALELVLSMLQNCGPVFRSSEPFIGVLKNHLCHSLIKNSVSSIPRIFGLSLQIFVMLITNFKEHLRTEIGVFIEQIFLRILESGNSTYQHKQRVLQVFYRLCTDASTALELFLNFDCDVDEKNIFGHMIDCLSKIAQGKYTSSEHSNLIQPHQEQELKTLALQALTTLMGSIVDWSRRMTEDQPGAVQLDEAAGKDASPAESDNEDDAFDTVSTVAASSVSMTTSASSTAIFEQKQRKHELQAGVNKFNMKPKRGVEYLKHHSFISDNPADLALLFQNSELGLDKTAIGDYLGEPKDFNKSVLYALVDGQDFRNELLDNSLRSFLSFFRLPGEAQKIDRMMEKFAEKYCHDNPDRFANADCAFVLSFSLIMLQTDLHNPGIKNKMTKDDFVRNNRGINDNADLPREFLEQLYENVASTPISLKEDEEAKTRLESQAAQGASQKFDLFLRETESIVVKSQELMKHKVAKQKTQAYVSAHNVQHVRPLFEVACWPLLATLAVLLETQEQAQSVELCIEGFKHCIRIAARFDMETERDAFVSSLAKFTYLTTIKEMKQKNIECIKALLAIGLSEGNNLGPSWQHILHCISQLERLQIIGSKTKQDFQYFHADEEAAAGAVKASNAPGNPVQKRRAHGLGVSALVSLGSENRQVELVNSESVTSQIDAAQIDLLFNRSTSLSSGAIVHFVTQLARVSKEELSLHEQPRIFSLQKLVETADFNMNRLRFVWTRIWRVLSQHFVEVASHPNIKVCMFAIDSLRQLAMKFLEKDELSNYNFQADFLRPFSMVVQSPGVNREVKELIVSIISNMVQARMGNIKSGWKIVFQILQSATEQGEAVLQVAFTIMQRVQQEHYDLFIENISDGVRTLLAFGQCTASLTVSMGAIEYLVQAAEHLADASKDTTEPDPPVMARTESPSPSGASPGGVDANHSAAHWFPILRGLSTLVSDSRRQVREAALAGVFDSLRKHGSSVFDEDTWRMVFNGVIKPLFDDIHHQLLQSYTNGTAASWAVSMGPPTCLAAMNELVRLVDTNLDALAFLLDDVLTLITNCVQHDIEAVARIGVEGFKQLLLSTGSKFSDESWHKVTNTVSSLFKASMPTKLLSFDMESLGDGPLPFRQQEVVTQCVVHLLLIDTVQDIVTQHYSFISPLGLMTLLDAMNESIDFAQRFNRQIDLRQTLKRLGFMREMTQLPGLLKQEREAMSCSLNMLFQIHQDPRMQESRYAEQARGKLKMLCCAVLRNYVEKERILREHHETPEGSPEAASKRLKEAIVTEMEREVMGLVSIISEVVLRGLKELRQQDFSVGFAADVFPLLTELTVVTSREVRLMVREVLKERVTGLVMTGCQVASTGSAGAT